jgi:hypothetical protein
MSDGNEPWAIALIAVVGRYEAHRPGWRPSATDMATDVRAELALRNAERFGQNCTMCEGSGLLKITYFTRHLAKDRPTHITCSACKGTGRVDDAQGTEERRTSGAD